MQNNLKVGDTIQRYNTEDCIRTMQELSKEGIMTEFLYEKDGKNRVMARNREGDGRWTKRKLEKRLHGWKPKEKYINVEHIKVQSYPKNKLI